MKPPASPYLVIDGDTIAFIAAAAVQTNFEDEHGMVSPRASIREGEVVVDNLLCAVGVRLDEDERWAICLSDPSGDNWRKDVDPQYKANRVNQAKPLILGAMKQYLRDRYRAEHKARLEADDMVGIALTAVLDLDGDEDRRPLAIGRDKDFRTIPGWHLTVGEKEHRYISVEEADAFFLAQVLAGDRVDGFDGCPGIGMTRAERIIAKPFRLVPQKGVITRGKNKGQETTKWFEEPTEDIWECITTHYEKAGLQEADALRTARLARILRYGEYDFETAEVRLWEPHMIQGRNER